MSGSLWRNIGVTLLGIVGAPLLITLLFLPPFLPTLVPFAIVLGLAGWSFLGGHRRLALGLALGTLAHFVLLSWLFSQYAGGVG